MKKQLQALLFLSVLAFSLTGLHAPAFACDLDGDGVDDLLTYQPSGSGSLNWTAFLSAGGTLTKLGFGDNGSFPAPGDYYSLGVDGLGVVNPVNFFWSILRPDDDVDKLNFGIVGVSFMPSRNWNGDGITDLAKFLNRCTKLTRRCSRRTVTGNFLLNDTDGATTFHPEPVTATGTFGRGLWALFAMDADSDGDDDVCFARHRRPKPRTFRVICKDVRSLEVILKLRIGRLFQAPLSIRLAGKDNILLWKKKAGATRVKIIDPSTGTKSVFDIPALPDEAPGKPLVGDWLSTGSQQVGIVSGGVLQVLNTLTNTIVPTAIPAGVLVDCSNNLNSSESIKFFTTRNVCKTVTCG